MRSPALVLLFVLAGCSCLSGGGNPPADLVVGVPVTSSDIRRSLVYRVQGTALVMDIAELDDGFLFAGHRGIARIGADDSASVHRYSQRPGGIPAVGIARVGGEFSVITSNDDLQAFAPDGRQLWRVTGAFGYSHALVRAGADESRIVVSEQGGEGVVAFDTRTGRLVSQIAPAGVPRLGAADLDRDGRSELVMKTEDGLEVSDLRGRPLAKLACATSWVVGTSSRGDEIAMLAADRLQIYGEDLKPTRELPRQFRSSQIQALRLRAAAQGKGDAPLSAFLIGGRGGWHRTSLLLYDAAGALRYHEVIGDDCQALHFTSRGGERLLVGCRDEVITYAITDSRAPRSR